MPDSNDPNKAIIDEFRANEGRVGGRFEGAPMILVHHVGRKSGTEYVNPMLYMRDDDDKKTVYVFASKGGAPTDPDWYANLVAAPTTTVEVGTEEYGVTVRDLHGDERDRVYAEHARRYPWFAEYAEQTAGIRVIPVVALTRE